MRLPMRSLNFCSYPCLPAVHVNRRALELFSGRPQTSVDVKTFGGASPWALAGARLIRTLLFGVTPTDPAVFGFTLIVIIGGVLAAALVPACRAVRSRR